MYIYILFSKSFCVLLLGERFANNDILRLVTQTEPDDLFCWRVVYLDYYIYLYLRQGYKNATLWPQFF